MDKKVVIAKMNEALALELRSVLLYLDLSFRVFGPNRKPVVEHFRGEAEESLAHATMLGEKVVALGGRPVVAAQTPSLPKANNLEAFLRAAIANEQAAVRAYAGLLEMVQDDTALRVLMENQVLAESEHLEELSKMLRR